MITVRRSKRTLMLGCSSFSAFFLLAMMDWIQDPRGSRSKRTRSARNLLLHVQKSDSGVKETYERVPEEGTNRPAYQAM